MYSIINYRTPRNLWRRFGQLDKLFSDDFMDLEFNWGCIKIYVNHKIEESEDSKTMNVKINVPGCTNDDINVTWNKMNNILEVTNKDKESTFHYASTISNKFIPTGSCGVKHGVLTVEFKRVEKEEEENLIQLL